MLQYLRKASEKPLAKVLIGILAFSFIGWGVAEWIFGNVMGDNTLVKVGNGKVTVQQFNMAKSHKMSALPRDKQRAIYTDAIATKKMNDEIISELTMQKMLENRAADLGFVVTDARIAREISEFPEFQQNGRFSADLFANALKNAGYSEADFGNILRSDILRSMVLGGIAIPIPVSDFALKAAYDARYGGRQIEYATVSFDDFKVKNPTDEDLKNFYAQNPHIIPEQRAISYVLVATDMTEPDSYDKGYEHAQRLEDEIIAGESLAKAAEKKGAKFVSLKAFSLDKRPTDKVLTNSLIDKAFAMEEGAESELLETKQGFVIMHIDKVIPKHNAQFESVKKSLVSDWKRAEQKKQAYIRANELLVNLNKNGKLQNKKSATVSRTSGAPLDVLVAAFDFDSLQNSIVSSKNAFYVLHIGKKISPKKDSAKMANLRKELQNMSNHDVMADYNAFLKREYPVKINQKVFKKFLQNK